MRTTVTLDPDVARRLKAWAHRQQLSFKEAVNTAIRRGLSAPASSQPGARFVVRPHRSAFRPGIDPGKLGQLADQLEADDFAARQRRSG